MLLLPILHQSMWIPRDASPADLGDSDKVITTQPGDHIHRWCCCPFCTSQCESPGMPHQQTMGILTRFLQPNQLPGDHIHRYCCCPFCTSQCESPGMPHQQIQGILTRFLQPSQLPGDHIHRWCCCPFCTGQCESPGMPYQQTQGILTRLSQLNQETISIYAAVVHSVPVNVNPQGCTSQAEPGDSDKVITTQPGDHIHRFCYCPFFASQCESSGMTHHQT